MFKSISHKTNHSFKDDLFFFKQDSKNILQFVKQFANATQLSLYYSISNEYLNKNATIFPSSSINLPLNQFEEKEEEIDNLNCDKIETTITENTNRNQLDNILTTIINNELNKDIISDTNSSTNIQRHFHRSKHRLSLTQTTSSINETEFSITDSIEKVDNNNNNEEEINEKREDDLVENEVSNEKTIVRSRFKIRKSRYQPRHDTLSTSQEPVSDNSVESFISSKSRDSSPPPSPISPTSNVSSCTTNSNILTGNLKRTGSLRTTKKMVRFADSVGRELTRVQYIHPLFDEDDCKEFSFIKNNLYIPQLSNFEHKPWSFDITLPSKQIFDYQSSKRFFCLYRQPNSEHADIYLHDIWRSQIKLEHADIRVKSYTTNEQHLYGTLWVTNASYWKYVTVKYTFNQWLNTYEYEARHVCHSNDFRNIDQFDFSIDIPNDIDRIDFVLRYCVNGQEYWDNNDGRNYTIETESASTPQTTISFPHDDDDFNEIRFY